MHDDPLERLAQLRDRADSIVQKLGTADSDQVFSGADGTGTVTATMNAAGHIIDVAVHRNWRRQVGVEGLPAAVREAVETAAVDRLTAWGDAFVELDEAPDPRARPMPYTSESTAYQLDELATARPTSGQGRAALRELLAMAEAIERGIDEVSARVREQIAASHTGYGGDRAVAVTITGDGAVTEVQYGRRWLLETGAPTIGRETADAFRAAYRQAAERTVADLVAQSPLGEVQALSQDPLGLARRLHLRTD